LKRLFCIVGALTLLAGPASARTILFLGSSFTYGAHSAAQHYRPETVHDLNGPDTRGDTFGGVPAIFKQFTLEAGLTDYDVSSELVGGKGLDYWQTQPQSESLSFRHLEPRRPDLSRRRALAWQADPADGKGCAGRL
jgi:hypothetical protein